VLHGQYCAECHGASGKGDVIVMHRDTPPKDQSNPAYLQTLADQDIKDLVARIRAFSGT